jgi:hypothetical protein
LKPLHALLAETILSSTKVFCDDTPLPVLDRARPRTRIGRIWCYAIDDRPWKGPMPPAVVHLFAEDRRGCHIAEHLAQFSGVLQVDAYAAYEALARQGRKAGRIILANCLAHARRKFFDLHKSRQDPVALEAVRRIAKIYEIEARIRGTSAQDRHATRQAETKPLMEALRRWLMERLAEISAKSKLAEAIRYTLGHWGGLTVFLDDGRVEVDNNTVERALRAIVTPVSLCTSSSSIWKHWKLIAGGDVTRAPSSPSRLHHLRRIQVRGMDLERRARNNLVGAKDTGLDQLAEPVAGDAASLRRFPQGQPGAVFLGGLVGVNTADTPDRADPVGGPGLVLASRQAHPVERGRDVLVGPSVSHTPYDSEGSFGGAACVLPAAGLTQTQFGMLSALPMNDHDDLARRLVDVDGDLIDQGTHQLLAAAHGDAGALPGGFEILGDGPQVRHRRCRGAGRRLVKAPFAVADAA